MQTRTTSLHGATPTQPPWMEDGASVSTHPGATAPPDGSLSSSAIDASTAVRTESVEMDVDEHNRVANGGSVTHFPDGAKGGGGTGGGGGGWRASSAGILDELRSSTKTMLFTSKLNVLLLFIPVCMMARAAGAGDGVVFALAVLAIVPLAERLGFATEEVAGHTNETVGGLLNATFGNVTEMVISIFALAAGELRVVQLSLLGSIFTNTLLVLGTAFFAGGLRHSEQTFNKKGVTLNAGLLLLAVVALVLPATLQATNTNSVQDALHISRVSSVFLLIGYFGFLTFQLKTHRHLFAEEEDEGSEGEGGSEDGARTTMEDEGEDGTGILNKVGSEGSGGHDEEKGLDGGAEGGGTGLSAAKSSFSSLSNLASHQATQFKRHLVRARQRTNDYSNNLFGFAMIPEMEHDNEPLSLRMSVMWLAIITYFVAVLSEALVAAINGASLRWGCPMAFLSAILLPMVGGIAEFAAAVQFAMKDKMDIAIGVAIGSSTQFALLVIPTCVLIGAMIGQPLDLDFGVFESTALLVVVLVVNANVLDGTSNWLKGLMLLVAYTTLATSIFYHTFDDNPEAA